MKAGLGIKGIKVERRGGKNVIVCRQSGGWNSLC